MEQQITTLIANLENAESALARRESRGGHFRSDFPAPDPAQARRTMITLDEALKRATNPDEFRLKIQGVQFTADISRDQMEESLQLQGEDDLLTGGSQFELEQF